jgi:uncharacterized damage-inducible protein DinB
MPMNELEMFLASWEREAANTVKLLEALPQTQYDFRPDPGGRSLGELAWHLAEGDAYISYGIERGQFTMDAKPPNIERPRAVEALAPEYERIHREAVARIRKLWMVRARKQVHRRPGAVFTISSSAMTVRQLRAVASTPRSCSARAASLDVPNPSGV